MRRLFSSLGLAVALSIAAVAAGPTDTRVADAAAAGNLTAVRALIKAGADVNGAQGDGMTALHWAAMKDDAAMTQVLVAAGASPKAITRLGDYTPMKARYDGPKGTVWRLSIKGFANESEARDRCEQLQSRGGKCFVRRTAGDAPVQMASR